MYILRSVTQNKKGEDIVDKYYYFDSLSEMIGKAYKIGADRMEAFEAVDITTHLYESLQQVQSVEYKVTRKRLYDTLKMEFDGQDAEG